jgi:signal transduction histidine kinase/DNA-binding response OmpR family regulator/ligand-binding sensor domain-containing protein
LKTSDLFIVSSNHSFIRAIALAILLLLFSRYPVQAQETFSSRRITVNEGLPQGFVSGIVQDDDGFIWLATRDGLARYDGYEMKVFRSNDDRSSTISSNVIAGLFRDRKNRIWIIHESLAIDVLDPREERFQCFTCDPTKEPITQNLDPNFFYVDSRENLWLLATDEGFWKVNLRDGTLSRISMSGADLAGNAMRGIIEAKENQYWIIQTGGIDLVDDQLHVIKHKAFDFSFEQSPYSMPIDLSYIHGDRLLIRARDAALIFDPHTNAITPIVNGVTDPHQHVESDWSPIDISSLNTIVHNMGTLYQIRPDMSVRKILSSKTEGVISFLVDRSGVAWFGYNGSGVHTINLKSVPFKSYSYKNSFITDLLQLQGITPNKRSWLNYSENSRFRFDSWSRPSLDSKNRLWLALVNNVAVIDVREKTITDLPPLDGDRPANELFSFTISGDTCWRLVSGAPAYFDEERRLWNFPLGTERILPPTTPVLDILKTGRTIWATTQHDGLIAIDLVTGKTKSYKQDLHRRLPTNELTDIEPDPNYDSVLWIGSRSGLLHFNKHNGQYRSLTMRDGLPNNMVYCIVADASGLLWISTNKGLCRFDPVSFKAQNFTLSDGLQGAEFNFFHKMKLPDGRIAFGGTEGITIFHPEQVFNDTFQPQVQLTKMKINNNDVEFSRDSSLLKEPLNSLSSLELKHDQNFLTFYFAALQFNDVEKTQYRYRLNGMEDEWNYTGALGMANYTKVPPGSYRLELNATNTSGVWSEHIRSMNITVSPPLWQTDVAYVFYGLLVIGAMVAYVRYTARKIRLENLVKLKNDEAHQFKQLNEIKNRFFTNITHEFRTPLTLIVSPAELLLKSTDLAVDHKNQVKLIQQNSRQLLQLVNQIMDLSKLEAGLMPVSLASVNLERFIRELIIPFQSMAESKHIVMTFESRIGDLDYLIDKEKLERIVNNLLSNAIKFTREGGGVIIKLSEKNFTDAHSVVELEVTDTGIGIPPEVLPFIFDRFYQYVDQRTREYEGTGIGLSLVKELVSVLGARISVESTLHKGTTFLITLPLEQKTSANHIIRADEDGSAVNVIGESILGNQKEDHGSPVDRPVILVVEDNDSLRDFLTDQLRLSYSVITAANGSDAWEKIIQEVPDLVITDVMMPVMNGLSLSKKIRESDAVSHIGLILLTARVSAESRLEGLQTGANDYISKPFSFEELQLRIANLLEHQKRQRAYHYNKLINDKGSALPIRQENEFLTKAYEFLDSALGDNSPVGVDDLASHFSMSSRTLNRKLSTLVGLTPSEFIRNYKLSKSTVLLLKGLTVAEVAYQVGFESHPYFTQCFKALYGVTPSEYIDRQSRQ